MRRRHLGSPFAREGLSMKIGTWTGTDAAAGTAAQIVVTICSQKKQSLRGLTGGIELSAPLSKRIFWAPLMLNPATFRCHALSLDKVDDRCHHRHTLRLVWARRWFSLFFAASAGSVSQ